MYVALLMRPVFTDPAGDHLPKPAWLVNKEVAAGRPAGRSAARPECPTATQSRSLARSGTLLLPSFHPFVFLAVLPACLPGRQRRRRHVGRPSLTRTGGRAGDRTAAYLLQVAPSSPAYHDTCLLFSLEGGGKGEWLAAAAAAAAAASGPFRLGPKSSIPLYWLFNK